MFLVANKLYYYYHSYHPPLQNSVMRDPQPRSSHVLLGSSNQHLYIYYAAYSYVFPRRDHRQKRLGCLCSAWRCVVVVDSEATRHA